MDYANFNEVKEGDKLVADGGFTCLKQGQVGTVVRTGTGDLAIPCDNGHHTLDGQVDDEGAVILGLSLHGG